MLSKDKIPENAEAIVVRKLKAETDEREAKARMAEMELSVMQGGLHEADHVKKIMIDMIVACRSLLLAIPSKVSTTLAHMEDPVEIASYVQTHIYEALDTLSEYDADKFNRLNDKYVPLYKEED
jgi:phage terminase Nu1 subunit (DNA packaging protein)